MTINYTTLLGLAQPVTGTEQGTWGTVVNDEITALLEEAVAGGETIDVTSGNVTLTDTDGVANQARNAILLITGTPGTSRNVVAPSTSKVYIVRNGSDGAVVLKGSATTGVTIPAGGDALCFWNGSDFEIGTTFTTILDVDNLRLDGNTISSTNTNGNIVIAPNGTGDVQVDADTLRVGDSNVNATITTNGTGDLILNTNSGSNSGSITIADGINGDIAISPNGSGTVVINTDLDVDNININGNTISSTDSNGNIVLAPNGTGDVQVDADTLRVGDSNANATVTTNGTGDLILNTNAGTNSGSITIADGTNGDISISPNGTGSVVINTDLDVDNININGNTISSTDTNGNVVVSPNGTGDVQLDADTVRIGDSNANATLTTNGTGDLILNTNAGSNSGSITIQDAANGNIVLAPNGTGRVQVSGTSSNSAGIELFEDTDNGTNKALVAAPSALGSDITVTLPEITSTLGYLNTPINSQSTAYTLVAADAAKTILHPISDNNARTFTIPANSSVPYPDGTVITFVNLINTVTIAITTDTMYLAGPGTTGSRTLAAYGVATAVKVASTTWVISGNGLT